MTFVIANSSLGDFRVFVNSFLGDFCNFVTCRVPVDTSFIAESSTLSKSAGLSTTFQVASKKFLSGRIVIIKRRRRSPLGGFGGVLPQGNFYILSPQKQNFLDSEHKFPIMSVPKVVITFQFYLYKLMPSVVFHM